MICSVIFSAISPDANNSAMLDVQPLILGTRDDIAVLALSPGSQYRVFASAVDNVGNRRSLEEDMQNLLTVDFPGGVCLNNCSGRGTCTEFSTCRCDPGYYGSDCSQGNVKTDLRGKVVGGMLL